jgi:Dihydroorotate dehydrogenase
VAVRAVHDCRAAFPTAGIVGVGGVARGVDVVEMMLAGADAVEVGTATFRDPRAPARVLAGLRRWCRVHDVGDVRSLVGAVHGVPPFPVPDTPGSSTPAPAPAPTPAPTPAPSVTPQQAMAPPGPTGPRTWATAGPPPWATAAPEPQSGAGPPRSRPAPVTRPDVPSRLPPMPPRPARGPDEPGGGHG